MTRLCALFSCIFMTFVTSDRLAETGFVNYPGLSLSGSAGQPLAHRDPLPVWPGVAGVVDLLRQVVAPVGSPYQLLGYVQQLTALRAREGAQRLQRRIFAHFIALHVDTYGGIYALIVLQGVGQRVFRLLQLLQLQGTLFGCSYCLG